MPAMDFPGQVGQSSKTDIRSTDNLRNQKTHQEATSTHHVEAKAT